jgi:hypothetical protein
MYIATQYGEGYVWIAAPSAVLVAAPSEMAPIDGLLAIAPAFAAQDHRLSQHASSLVGQLRDRIAASVGAGQKIVIVENWRDATTDGLRHVLQVSFQADNGRLDCTATLREMPSKHIVKAFRLDLDSADATSFTSEATRVANGVVDTLRQALTDASTASAPPRTNRLKYASARHRPCCRRQIRNGWRVASNYSGTARGIPPTPTSRCNGACICSRALCSPIHSPASTWKNATTSKARSKPRCWSACPSSRRIRC